jgi:hypothetical protein
MWPPRWVCENLYGINRTLRMGWVGRDKKHEDELNPGSFAVVQLYSWYDVGYMDDLKTYREFWDRTLVPNDNGVVQFTPAFRGPLFDRHGGTRVDYDPFDKIPIFVCTIDEQYHHKDGRAMSTQDVFNGSFLDTIKYWLVPYPRRLREQYREAGKRLANEVHGLGEEAGKFLYRESQRTGHTNNRIAKKFTKGVMQKAELNHEKSRAQLENYYLEHI